MSNQNQEFSITLSLQEINAILEILSQRPYVEVFGLIQKLQLQAQGQLPAQREAVAAGDNGATPGK